MKRNEIIKRAKERAKIYATLSNDPRTKNVLGKLKYEGWIRAPHIRQTPIRLFLKDALWVGENVEPRVLELLPAVILKCPRTFYNLDLPNDLKAVIRNLKKGEIDGNFRSIPLRDCYRWIKSIGRQNKYPTFIKSFRFNKEDQELLRHLAVQRNSSETQVIRDALRSI